MANAKKCDRCGKFYQETVREKLKVRQYVEMSCSYTEYDLCPKCTEKLKAFLRFDRKVVKKEELDTTTISMAEVELKTVMFRPELRIGILNDIEKEKGDEQV